MSPIIRRFFTRKSILVALVIAAGFAVRVAHVESLPFWVDESESSINALTILQHGYPADHYLGLPIYENTLVWPWPGNPEYEFRDISYSDKGMAVYHGWLPLYAIAASFALHRIGPDESNSSLKISYSREEAERRTRAARLPSVVFGTLLLLILFAAGHAFYGNDAAWIALLAAAIHPTAISVSLQARYYSAEVALSMACCLSIWMIITKGRWIDFLLGALCFVLLFHTHLISFVMACGFAVLMIPALVVQRRTDLKKTVGFALIISSGTIPWLVITGFFQHQSRIPRAWKLLSLPGDLVRLLPGAPVTIAALLLFLASVAWLAYAKPKVSNRLKKPLFEAFWPTAFLVVWAAVAYASFLLFIPAASLFPDRISLNYWGPRLMVGSIVCAAIIRIIAPRVGAWRIAAGALSVAMLTGFSGLSWLRYPSAENWSRMDQIVGQLRAMNLHRGTMLYATGNDHLTLTFYTGLPFQKVAPIRKSFLDEYPGDVVLVDLGESRLLHDVLQDEELLEAARQSGQVLSKHDAECLVAQLGTREFRQKITGYVGGASSSNIEKAPQFIDSVTRKFQKQLQERFSFYEFEVMTKGYSPSDVSDWYDVFYYRFVNPDSRRGPNRNYLHRLRGATGYILPPWGDIIYYSRGQRDESKGLDFIFVSCDSANGR